MNFASYNARVVDEKSDNEEANKYILFFSSQKCPHSKKMLRLLKKTKLDPKVEERMVPLDVMERITRRQEIPNYVEYVPALIISDEDSETLIDILYGNDVIEWVKKQVPKKPKQSFSESGGYASKDCYSRHDFAAKIEVDKHGRPVNDDPAQFQIPMDQGKRNVATDDFSKYQQELAEQNEEFGISSGLPAVPKQSKTKAKGGVSSFQSGGSTKKSNQRFASYNS